MNIVNLLIEINALLSNCERELASGNVFFAKQNLVKLRELLNEQPELKAYVALESAKPSKPSTIWEHFH